MEIGVLDFLMECDGYSRDFSEGLIRHVVLNGYLGRSRLRVVPSVAERPGIGLVNLFFFVLVLCLSGYDWVMLWTLLTGTRQLLTSILQWAFYVDVRLFNMELPIQLRLLSPDNKRRQLAQEPPLSLTLEVAG